MGFRPIQSIQPITPQSGGFRQLGQITPEVQPEPTKEPGVLGSIFSKETLKGEPSFKADVETGKVLPNVARTFGNIPSSAFALATPVNPFNVESPINIGGAAVRGFTKGKDIIEEKGALGGAKQIGSSFLDLLGKGFKAPGEAYIKYLESTGYLSKEDMSVDPSKLIQTSFTKPAEFIAKTAIEDPLLIPSFMFGGGAVKGKDIISKTARPTIEVAEDVAKTVADLTRKSEAQINNTIIKKYKKGVTPLLHGKTTLGTAARYDKNIITAAKTIEENKPKLQFTDELGDVVKEGKTPVTLNELAQSLEQTKKSIFSQYDELATKAGDKGLEIKLDGIADQLDEFIANKALQLTSPKTITYAEALKERLEGIGKLDAKTAQEAIQNYNKSLEAYYRNPSYDAASQATLDAMIVNKMRETLDKGITGLTGEQYQTLKNKYASLKSIERDVLKANLKEARKSSKGLIDYTDIFSAGEAVAGIMSLNPALFAKGAAQKGIATYYKYLNSKNKAIRDMFRAVEKSRTAPKGTRTSRTKKKLGSITPKGGLSIEDVSKKKDQRIPKDSEASRSKRSASRTRAKSARSEAKRSERDLKKDLKTKTDSKTAIKTNIINNTTTKTSKSKQLGKLAPKKVKQIDNETKNEMLDVVEYLRGGKETKNIEDTLSRLMEKYGIDQELSSARIATKFEKLVEKTKTKDISPREILPSKLGTITPKKTLGSLFTKKDPDLILNPKKDVLMKDIAGNKFTIESGAGIAVFKTKGNNYIVKTDKGQFKINKGQYENLKGQSKTSETKEFAPEFAKTEETVKGVKLKKQRDLTSKEQKELDTLISEGRQTSGFYDTEKGARAIELQKIEGTYKTTEDITKFSKYTLNGGKNYKEILIRAPEVKSKTDIIATKNTSKALSDNLYFLKDNTGKDLGSFNAISKTDAIEQFVKQESSKANFKSSHFSEPNILAHIRMNSRTYKGKKAEFLEEAQSDWNSEGRKRGFADGKFEYTVRADENVWVVKSSNGKAFDVSKSKANSGESAIKYVKENNPESTFDFSGKVPSNPLLKNWQELAVKRALKEAVDNNAEYFMWINGKQTSNRYNLATYLKKTRWETDSKGLKDIDLHKIEGGTPLNMKVDKNGTVVESHKDWNGKKLDEVLGKGLADKIMGKESGTLSGEGLSFGGEWAVNLYDKQLGNIVKKLTGKDIESFDMGLGIKDLDKLTETKELQQGIRLTPEVKAIIRSEAPKLKTPKEPTINVDSYGIPLAVLLLAKTGVGAGLGIGLLSNE